MSALSSAPLYADLLAKNDAQPGGLAGMLPLLIIGVLFIGWMWWSSKRRRAQALEQRAALKAGDRVLLQHGEFATLVSISDRIAVLEVAPGVQTTWLAGAIARPATEEENNGWAVDPGAPEADENADAETTDATPSGANTLKSDSPFGSDKPDADPHGSR